eukprot:11763640-Ditylum_brightwellii.AAC.1
METIMWDDASIPMNATSAQVSNSFHIKDPKGISDMGGHIAGDTHKTILRAKYEKDDLKKEVEDNCLQLNSGERNQESHHIIGDPTPYLEPTSNSYKSKVE